METISKVYRTHKDIFFTLLLPTAIWLTRPILSFINPKSSVLAAALYDFLNNDLLMYACAILSITAFVFSLLKIHHHMSRPEQRLCTFFLIQSFGLGLLSLFALI